MSKVCSNCKVDIPLEGFTPKRNVCKKCVKNSNKCEHNKRKTYCKECGGGALCSHGKHKYRCKECGGSGICEHSKIKTECKECKGGSLCEHLVRKSNCKECGGSSYCEHGKRKSRCKECGGSELCIHSKLKTQCKECKGSSICEHSKIRKYCKECGGSAICEHRYQKRQCVICNPSCACINCKLVCVPKKTISHPYCQSCFCNLFPDDKRATLYKTKERYLLHELKHYINNENILVDKIIDNSCSNKRPDILIDKLTYCIIVECDENQHKRYEEECENKRTMELFLDLGNRPLIMIRFNPDSYITKDGIRVKGCFTPVNNPNKRRYYDVDEDEWKTRVNAVKEVLKQYLSLETFPEKEVTEIKLFFDGYQ